MTTAADVQRVLDDHPALSLLGYGGNGGDIAGGRAELMHPVSIEAIGRAAAWAREHLAPRQTANPHRTSYGLKHLAEPDIGYTTNGQFIVALLLAGFRMRPRPEQPNPVFTVSERSAKALERWRVAAVNKMRGIP